ncbi:MAG TPA: NADH-quinone oxidoreductase subunit B family protein [Pyrinomonadaceae bacterium]|nr:NADH-quinone oxidoreductase subunit B family protein [Pyrinomonadaceae bacterium]
MSLFAKILRTPAVTEALEQDSQTQIAIVGQEIGERARKLFGRSLHIREVDAGSCNGCELEISALGNPYYDMERFGLHIVASPRHADCLLVTGPVTRNMVEPLRRTYEATPDPKIVIATGDCGINCGVFKDSYAVFGSVDKVVPVNVFVPGCPPEPLDILRGILSALDRLPRK